MPWTIRFDFLFINPYSDGTMTPTFLAYWTFPVATALPNYWITIKSCIFYCICVVVGCFLCCVYFPVCFFVVVFFFFFVIYLFCTTLVVGFCAILGVGFCATLFVGFFCYPFCRVLGFVV